MSNSLQARVAKLLATDGRPMRQMARDLDIDVGYLSRLLSGQKPFHPKTLNAMLAWLNVTGLHCRALNELGAKAAGWEL